MKMLVYGLVVVILGVLAVSCSISEVPVDDLTKEIGKENMGSDESKEKDSGGESEPVIGLNPVDLSGARDGDSPEEYGFVVGLDNAGLPAFIIYDAVIQSNGTAGGWLDLDYPTFQIDSTENGGVVVSWELRYSDSLPNRSREKSKFYIKLLEDGQSRYMFEYKPFLNDGDCRDSSLIVDGLKTSANQIAVTPSGSESPWLKFKMVILDTGEITVYYDYDGYGWKEMIVMIDTSYTYFNGIRFTYRTTAEPKYYAVQLRNLSVLPIVQ